MIYTLKEISEIISPIAQKYSIPAVYLFGSYARGEATADSDVDILFDKTGSKVEGFVIGSFYNALREGLGKEVSLVTTDALEQYKDQDRRFRENILRERVLIYKAY